jgi:hypothetical protein
MRIVHTELPDSAQIEFQLPLTALSSGSPIATWEAIIDMSEIRQLLDYTGIFSPAWCRREGRARECGSRAERLSGSYRRHAF